MKRTIKKALSALLVIVILMGLAMPTFAATVDPEESKSQIPVIRVLGDGEPMYDAEGKKLFHIRTSFSDSEEEEDDEESDLLESVANVLLPFLIDGRQIVKSSATLSCNKLQR